MQKVNSGSFYHFFESKEALLREVLRGYLEALRPVIVEPAFSKAAEPIARIFAIHLKDTVIESFRRIASTAAPSVAWPWKSIRKIVRPMV